MTTPARGLSVGAAVVPVLTALLLTPSVVAAQADAEKAVLAAIAQVNDAFQRGDVKAYDALTTADFVRVGSNGRAFDKAGWLKTAVPNSGPARRAGAVDEVSVRVFGDAALVTYRNTPLTADGKPGGVGYLTRVMQRQGGQWKMAFAQSTDLKPPAPPAGPAPASLPPWSASTPIEKEALAAFEAIQKANRDRDVAAWERLSAADHAMIGADGARTTRAQRVANLKAPAPATTTPAAAQADVRLRVIGDSLAVVTWRAGEARSLKVLARRGAGWQQVLQQSSPIVAAKP